MVVERFDIEPEDWSAIERALDTVQPTPIASCNWAKEYPYAPHVEFRALHTGNRLVVRFDVAERYTMAHVTESNGEVWTDSCVELFIAPDSEGYYNIETNCIGTMLVGYRQAGKAAEHASSDLIATFVRMASLGSEPFDEREGDNRWSLTLSLPPEVMFRHKVNSWTGVELRANLYKCGDKLSHPHFLSWQPIVTEKPSFHQPSFFGVLTLK